MTKFSDFDGVGDFLLTEMGFCVCGDTGAVIERLTDILGAYAEDPPNWEKLDELLPKEPVFRDAYLFWLDNAGLIEHGGSICASWLDDRGIDLLKALGELPEGGAFREGGE